MMITPNALALASSSTATEQEFAQVLFTHSTDRRVMRALAANPAVPVHFKLMLSSRPEPEIAVIASRTVNGGRSW